MAESNEKGLWPSFIDGVMKALASAFITAAGWMLKENADLKKQVEDLRDELAKTREIERRRADPAERGRVRDRWKDPS